MIRVLLAEDEEMIRDALVSLLEREPDIEVVATAADGPTAVGGRWRTGRTSPWSTWRCPAWTGWAWSPSWPGCCRRARW